MTASERSTASPLRTHRIQGQPSPVRTSANQIWVLVDLPNWLAGQELGNRTYPKAKLVLREIAKRLQSVFSESTRAPLHIRLYSSWHTSVGDPTVFRRQVPTLLTSLESELECIWPGRVRVAVAESIGSIQLPAIGYRRSGQQKLVDTHLVADAIYLAWRNTADEVAVASSDADMLPGLLTASVIRQRMIRDCRKPVWVTSVDPPQIVVNWPMTNHIRVETIS